jgi:hypothetical protein
LPEPAENIARLRAIIARLTPADGGAFFTSAASGSPGSDAGSAREARQAENQHRKYEHAQ